MTAEAAVLNKSAVALAADSMASITRAGDINPKKTHEVNKLFTLSKYMPVGIMVYADSEFMQVPWETVIKEYRRKLANQSFGTIDEYTQHFLSWIATSDIVCSQETQRQWFRWWVGGYLRSMVDEQIDKRVESVTNESESITEEQIREIVIEVLKSNYDNLDALDARPHLPITFGETLEHEYLADINEVIDESLHGKPLDEEATNYARKIAVMLFSREQKFPRYSGVVVAGFGELEVFPVVKTAIVYGAVIDTPIFRIDEEDSIEEGTSGVIPFAQRDVADTFLQGINPDAMATIQIYLTQVLNRLPAIMAESVQDDDDKRKALIEKLENATKNATENFTAQLLGWLEKRHVTPLLEFLRHAPKEELAELAESLVSLTSIKRKVEEGLATVGGPIDVAIITKGDGFVWIRRKHYFDPQINFAFKERYFNKEE